MTRCVMTWCVIAALLGPGATFADGASTGVAPPSENASNSPSAATSPAVDRPLLIVPGGVSVILPFDARCLGVPEWQGLGQRLANAEAHLDWKMVALVTFGAFVLGAVLGGVIAYVTK